MFALKIIVGSTRDGRQADRVVPWLVERARAHEAFDVELLDLRDWPLPMFQETAATIGDPRDPTYSEPIVREWNHTVRAADAVVLLTPEYNHSFSAVLKNALDSVFVSFGLRHKPIGFVGYSNSAVGAARAVEQLVQVACDFEAVPLRNSVLLGNVAGAIVDGEPTQPATDIALQIMLDDLAWWAGPLKAAREAGQLPPGPFRFRAAMSERADAAR